MNHTERSAKSPFRRTGFGVRSVVSGAAAAVVAVVIMGLLPAAASADTSFGEEGSGPGQFQEPQGVAVSRQSGDIYVVDFNQRVNQFDHESNFIRAFGWGVLNGAAELQACTATCQHGLEGSGPGQLSYPFGIAVDNDPASSSYGDVWVSDPNNFRVEKYSPTGAFLLMLGGEVDKTTHANICTKESGDTCGAGVSGLGAGQFQWPQGSGLGLAYLATGPGGALYVGDTGRVEQFEPGGAFAGEFALKDAAIPTEAIAVDDSCATHEPPLTGATTPTCEQFDPSDGDVYVHQDNRQNDNPPQHHEEVPGVQKYSAAGTELETLDPTGHPNVLAVDASGDLFLGDPAGSEYEFLEFTPTGVPFALFTSPVVKPVQFGAPVGGIAVGDSAGQLYATNRFSGTGVNDPHGYQIAAIDLPQAGPPIVKPESERATDIEPTTATLNALVNPEGLPTGYHFEYGTEAGVYTHPTASQSLPLTIRDDPAQAAISGLLPSTVYHFRAVAESECEPEVHPGEKSCKAFGEDTTFETLPPVSVRGFTTQTVAPELVQLKAEISPDNGTATEYEICYGEEEENYSDGCVNGEVHKLGNEFEGITATFEHLEPNTEYHYQLTATNSYGIPVETPDATFTTEETLAEEDARAACSNAQLRSESKSLALPDCRAYEQVSPAAKGGYALSIYNSLAPGGERSAFQSSGAFPGAPTAGPFNFYLAHRTAAGWVTQFVLPRLPGFEVQGINEFAAGLDRWLIAVNPASSEAEGLANFTSKAYYLGSADGSFVAATPVLSPEGSSAREVTLNGSSADLSQLFLQSPIPLVPGDPRPSARERIYRVSGVGGPEPTFSIVAELGPGLTNSSCSLDATLEGLVGGRAGAASADGSTLFYEAPLEIVHGGECSGPSEASAAPNKNALFARVGEEPPVQVAPPPTPLSPQCHSSSPCATAAIQNVSFLATSPDASRAWFYTRQPLVDSDADPASDEGEGARDLYLAKLAGGQVTELIQASHGDATDPTPGRGAGFQGILGISQDAQRAYFVATGVLTAAANPSGDHAAQGADNLYAYDAQTEEAKFVARLCSGQDKSGSVADPACTAAESVAAYNQERSLWNTNPAAKRVQLTPDGRFLLFDSIAQLTPDDTDAAVDVYRYDLQTGRLTRVSFGRRGNDANGNDEAFDATIPPLGGSPAELDRGAGDTSRAISSDGSTAVFTTAAPLVSRDTNLRIVADGGALPGDSICLVKEGCPLNSDVYEWSEDGHGTCHEAGGCIALISDGADPQGATTPVLSASGNDVTFLTPAGLAPADTDGLKDLYDARVDGGFPRPAEPPICTSGETCLGPIPPLPPPPQINSEGETGGNGKPKLPCAKGKVRVTRHGQQRCVAKKHHHKKHKRANRNGGGAK